MPWLDSKNKAKSHKCPVPEGIIKSERKITSRSRWQCPDCHKIWEVEWRTWRDAYLKQHKVGNDYWYYIQMHES